MANVTYTVPNKNGSYDGDMVVKQYTSVAIDTGDTVTVDQPCRGLMILVSGDCTINGTLSMKAKGAAANPSSSGGNDSNSVDTNGLRFPFLTSSGSDTLTAANTLLNGCGALARTVIANFRTLSSNGTILSVPKVGGAGGAGQTGGSPSVNGGGTIANGTGGGGAGNAAHSGVSGSGTAGTCFAGGSAGGGSQHGTAGNAADYAGAGGTSTHSGGHNYWHGGGGGNPAGTGWHYNGAYSGGGPVVPETGNGGLIILIVGGNLTIGSGGKIIADGSMQGGFSNPGSASYSGQYASTGGSTGGGRIIIAHRGTYTNNGSVTANGGVVYPGHVNDSSGGTGGVGGAGAITVQAIQ